MNGRRQLMVLAAFTVAAFPVWADVPDTLPLQGILTDSDGVPIDGTPNLRFAILDQESGGTELWSETHTSFSVTDGFFTVYLGEITPLDAALLASQPELWMQISVNGEPLDAFQLGSLPYAFESAVCRQVGALEEGDIQPMLSDTNACAAGYYLRGWDASLGEPICALDTFAEGDFSGVVQVAGTPPIVVDSTDPENPVVSIDGSAIPPWLNTTCSGNNFVKSINPTSGAVTCAVPPNDDSFAAVTCPSGGQLLEWSGSAWVCADDIATELYADTSVNALASELSDGDNTTTPVSWDDLTGVPSSSGVPSGAVMAFDLDACPAGWTELTTARGRVVVGIPAGGTRGGTAGTALTDLENRAVGTHQHDNSPPQATTSSTGAHSHTITDPGHTHSGSFITQIDTDPGTYTSTTTYYYNSSIFGGVGTATTGITIDTNTDHEHTVTVPTFQSAAAGSVAGTNAPYIQLLYCRKD